MSFTVMHAPFGKDKALSRIAPGQDIVDNEDAKAISSWQLSG